MQKPLFLPPPMQATDKCSILTIVPYRIIPPTNGGHAGILYMHDHIGKLCSDQLVTTKDTGDAAAYAFDTHRIFATGPNRYVPFANQKEMLGIAHKYDVKSIMCEHPYMAISANALAKKLGVPWYLRSHNIESQRFRSLGKPWWRILAWYEKWAMQKAKGTFFVTQEEADWASVNYQIDKNKCHFAPFGCLIDKRPAGNKEAAKSELAKLWDIDANKKWLYFIGSLDYKPNEDAVKFIINDIAPMLRNKLNDYQILIGGKGLSKELQDTIAATSDIKYTGFIPDLNDFLTACDVMINPVITGGGIKTKAVEALAYNKMVVSTVSGAEGLVPSACGVNLLVSGDDDWSGFCEQIITATTQQGDIPETFYQTYYWGNVAQKVIDVMQSNFGR